LIFSGQGQKKTIKGENAGHWSLAIGLEEPLVTANVAIYVFVSVDPAVDRNFRHFEFEF
jgi:hypothetical protein